MSEYKKELAWFVGQMEAKLSIPVNMNKDHWLEEGLQFLREGIRQEVKELESALNDCDLGNAIKECADVANRSMMIADYMRMRIEQAKERDQF